MSAARHSSKFFGPHKKACEAELATKSVKVKVKDKDKFMIFSMSSTEGVRQII
jgi:hypothetical protein